MSTLGVSKSYLQTIEEGDVPWLPSIPGQTIKEDILDRLGMTQGELAVRLGVARRSVNEIIVGKRGISVEMALRLSKLTGQSPQYWLALQNNYDLAVTMRRFDNSDIVPL